MKLINIREDRPIDYKDVLVLCMFPNGENFFSTAWKCKGGGDWYIKHRSWGGYISKTHNESMEDKHFQIVAWCELPDYSEFVTA